MKTHRKASCRRVRAWLQDARDRQASGPPGSRASQPPGSPAGKPSRFARAAEAHLEHCAECRRFREFLSGYGRELAAALDGLTSRIPLPDLPAREGAIRRDPSRRGEPVRRVASRRASSRRVSSRRAFPRRRTVRWVIPAAAAALLAVAAGIQAPRLTAGARVERRLRAEMAALVEELYAQPLAQGVEGSLAGQALWEGLAEGDGLQDLGLGEGPSASSE